MQLDYTQGCVNFRDVGEFLALITDNPILPPGRLYRGGSIDHVKALAGIGEPGTVVNLRKKADYEEFETTYIHFPADNKVEVYHTHLKNTRRWLNSVIRTFENRELSYPVLVHCLSGNDRTGIVIGALLMILRLSEKVVLEEYQLSEGKLKFKLMKEALAQLKPLDRYFNRIDLDLVASNLIG